VSITVDGFSTLEQLEPIRERWTQLYELDPDANFFLSWQWLSASLATESKRWIVLGAREADGPYLAFLPLSFGRFPRIGPALTRELSLAGSPRADFTGMLGVAGQEWRFIPALAREIEALPWDNLTLSDYADARIAALAAELGSRRYSLASGETIPCPYVELPKTWEAYLDSRSHATRRTIRTKMRKIESLPGYRLHFAPLEEARDAVETLLRLNSSRWKKNLRTWRDLFEGLLTRCYASGRFRVVAMYHGNILMAAQGSFVDPTKRTMLGYMMGYNVEYARFSPGTMLICASIRRAIEEGYDRYDLSRGGQTYKTSLATHFAYTTHTTLSRRGVRVVAVNAARQSLIAAKRVARHFLVRPA
jgi:CelD/BcsL family acetyltransferase involved in cellulose biosynthesis